MHQIRRLGPFLCWAIVYADIGTSIYYVPGILYRDVGASAASYVLASGVVFLFLAEKYAGIAARYPNGGGVVSVAQDAFGPRIGAAGGMLILTSYFLTAAISSVSGIAYLSSLVPALTPFQLPLVVLALGLLGVLNWIGIRESAQVSAIASIAGLATLLTVAGFTASQMHEGDWSRIQDALGSAGRIPVADAVVGFSAAWLAFSGVESLAQISPAMREPRRRTAGVAMGMVAISVLAIGPLLTAFGTNLLDPAQANPDALQAELAAAVGGRVLHALVVVAASVLLLFAANTAVVGAYHVFGALADADFLPAALLRRSHRFGTPAVAIAVATVAPAAIVVATFADVAQLGALYAFGLLGAFVLSSTAVDRIRIAEGETGINFVLGLVTSGLLILAWLTNLIQKPDATLFGGSLAAAMLAFALVQRGDLRLRLRQTKLVSADEAERLASEAPGARLLRLADAVELQPLYPVRTLVCVRGPNQRLLEEAATHVKGEREPNVAVLFVEEVPGLFVPRDTEPAREAREVLNAAFEWYDKRGITALPIWRIAQSAGDAIAEAALDLEVNAVFVGVSRRGALWRMLRGSALNRLIARVPPQTRLVIVG